MSTQNGPGDDRPTHRLLTAPGATAVAALLLAVGPGAVADDDFAGDVLECRSLSSAEDRLACYDRVVDGYDAPGPASAAAAPEPSEAEPPVANRRGERRDTTVGQDTARSAESVFGLPPQADPRDTLEEIEATIVSLKPSGTDKLAITLDNGHVWRQTTSSSLRLSVGDVVVIERASFGSHRLSKPDTNRSMRVRRVE